MPINIISSVIHRSGRVGSVVHAACHAHIIQRKQKGNKCWNKILLISPGAANRPASMEGAKSPFLFYCMNANPAGKRLGRRRAVCGGAVTRLELAALPVRGALDPREVSPSTLPTRKKRGWAARACLLPVGGRRATPILFLIFYRFHSDNHTIYFTERNCSFKTFNLPPD